MNMNLTGGPFKRQVSGFPVEESTILGLPVFQDAYLFAAKGLTLGALPKLPRSCSPGGMDSDRGSFETRNRFNP